MGAVDPTHMKEQFTMMRKALSHIPLMADLISFIETQHPDARKEFRCTVEADPMGGGHVLKYHRLSTGTHAPVFKPVHMNSLDEADAHEIAFDINTTFQLGGSVQYDTEDEYFDGLMKSLEDAHRINVSDKAKIYEGDRTPNRATRREGYSG